MADKHFYFCFRCNNLIDITEALERLEYSIECPFCGFKLRIPDFMRHDVPRTKPTNKETFDEWVKKEKELLSKL